jgi:hypothetical protein
MLPDQLIQSAQANVSVRLDQARAGVAELTNGPGAAKYSGLATAAEGVAEALARLNAGLEALAESTDEEPPVRANEDQPQ